MALSIVGLVAYLPAATFLYSNVQFINRATDLKYHPQYMVYLALTKLLFSMLSSFLSYDIVLIVMRQVLMAAILMLLGLYILKRQPCIVAEAN